MSEARKSEVDKQYTPPWTNLSIVAVAGSSGSGKSTLSRAIVSRLNLPWVVILSMDSFYKTLSEEASRKAFLNEYDFDAPEAIDFAILRDRLRDLKAGKRAEIPVYSFAKHARQKEFTSIYSPHVLILEGIFALYDTDILDLVDVKIFCEEDADTCLSRRILRDVEERDRDIEGCIKQWFAYVKPNFERYVEPQRKVADIIVPRGVENQVAIMMVTQYIERKLDEKSNKHQAHLRKLEQEAEDAPLSSQVLVLNQTPQLRGMSTIIQDADTSAENFVFYFDRLAALLVEKALNTTCFASHTITTPLHASYNGLHALGTTSAVLILRAGDAFSTGLRRVVPDCLIGRMLIQSAASGEPELHYLRLPQDIAKHASVLLLDPQMMTGGAALMAVQVLRDHGVEEERITLVTYTAGKKGLKRLGRVWSGVRVVCCEVVEGDCEGRWVDTRYFGC